MNREFFTVVLTSKPALLRAMLAFNGVLDASPLPAELAAFPQAATLWADPLVRARFHASRPADPDFWDFEEEMFRLALLDAPTLDRLVMTFGVAVLAPELCRLLRREAVQQAREHLGEALFAYALHRARFQVQGAAVPPEVHGPPAVPATAPVHVRAHAAGLWGLRAVASRWPHPLRRRLAVLDTSQGTSSGMSPDMSQGTPQEPVLEPDRQAQLWAEMKKVLLKEVAPSWAPCFD